MRIVVYTKVWYHKDPLVRYVYAHVRERFHDVLVVAIEPSRPSVAKRLRRAWRKLKRLGGLRSLLVLTSYPLARYLNRRDGRRAAALLGQLSRPDKPPPEEPDALVHSVNGPDAVNTLQELEPDVIVQVRAGILRPQVFEIAHLATINMHHGIAPLIKGMNAIRWGLLERRPEWIGATIHRIDEGIDTGEVLAYAPVNAHPGEGYAQLFARSTQKGVNRMLDVLRRLKADENWAESPPPGEHCYRSTLSGWELLLIEVRLWWERRRRGRGDGVKHTTEERLQ